jgi:hypothetical protein
VDSMAALARVAIDLGIDPPGPPPQAERSRN